MSVRTSLLVDAASLVGIGAICLPILLLLLPNLEMARSETRMTRAFLEVHRLAESMDEESTDQAVLLTDRDPWGRPYLATSLADGRYRVVSSGPNQTSPRTGLDNDDISSDMQNSPAKAIITRKRRRAIVAFFVTVIAWIGLALLYFRRPRRSFH